MPEAEWGSEYADYASRKSAGIADEGARNRTYSSAFAEIARSNLDQRGIQITETPTPEEKSEQLRNSLSSKLLKSLANKTLEGQLDSLNNLETTGYPPVQAARDVALVIGKFKRVDPRTIAAADPLTKYRFEDDEKRSMAILLDDFYLSRGFTMAKQIQPWETQSATYVADFVASVVEHNPHRN
jgi:hypothetical protein